MLEWIISSAVLLAAVIAVRYALRGRLRPGVQYAMWAIVLVRLLVPVSFGSGAYSAGTAAAALEQTPAVQAVLTPSMDYDAAYSQVAREYAGRGLDASELAPRQQQAMEREIRALQRPTAVQVLQWVWLGGMTAMALALTGSNLRLYIRLRRSRRELTREGRVPVYVTEAVDTPCLFGLVRPAVYLTPEAAGDDVTRQHSVAHELTHLRHGDHVWSLLRCVCLAVHWYDPLVWWAAVLSRRDAELACDDATIRRLGEEQRAAYGRTLVRMTCRRPGNLLVTATTMTDGAGGSGSASAALRSAHAPPCTLLWYWCWWWRQRQGAPLPAPPGRTRPERRRRPSVSRITPGGSRIGWLRYRSRMSPGQGWSCRRRGPSR